MKNILYIGQYKDNNGFGSSCRRYLDYFINNNKYNISSRPIYVTYNAIAPAADNDNYIEYENNTYKKYDTIIQQVYPEYLEYHKNFGKNIAIVEIETLNIKHSGWIDKLNLMDEIWVGSIFSANSLKASGIFKTVKVVPEPYNLIEFSNQKESFFNYKEQSAPFIFYTIGQYAEKKNIKSIILAYLLEFNKQDNVKLFIKTCDYRKSNTDVENLIKYDMSNIKNIIRKQPENYADVDVLCGYLQQKDMIRLHQSSNCYINAVKSDGFGSSAIEAAICDKIVINSKNVGSSTYFNNSNAIMLNSIETNVFCSNSPIKNIYTMYERWFDPSINDLRHAMRKAYSLTKDELKNINNNFDKNMFTYDSIENIIK